MVLLEFTGVTNNNGSSGEADWFYLVKNYEDITHTTLINKRYNLQKAHKNEIKPWKIEVN